jgi:hypothetical protein
MKYVIIYYLIGTIVSLYHIWFYRYSKYKQAPKKSDSWASLIGVWLWPAQIVLFFYQKKFLK